MDQAKATYVENHRATRLQDQAERWHLARRLEAYLEAMAETLVEFEDADDKAQVSAWHLWATEYKNSIDPLHDGVEVPVPPNPKPEELREFLPGGVSPYGIDVGNAEN